MKKYLTFGVVAMILCIFACSTGEKAEDTPLTGGVAFEKSSLQDAIVKATEQDKFIVVDFFSPT